jgi:hypothetical protein
MVQIIIELLPPSFFRLSKHCNSAVWMPSGTGAMIRSRALEPFVAMVGVYFRFHSVNEMPDIAM